MKRNLIPQSATLLTVPSADVYARKNKTDNVNNTLVIKL